MGDRDSRRGGKKEERARESVCMYSHTTAVALISILLICVFFVLSCLFLSADQHTIKPIKPMNTFDVRRRRRSTSCLYYGLTVTVRAKRLGLKWQSVASLQTDASGVN